MGIEATPEGESGYLRQNTRDLGEAYEGYIFLSSGKMDTI
jgi:hypothetical protein